MKKPNFYSKDGVKLFSLPTILDFEIVWKNKISNEDHLIFIEIHFFCIYLKKIFKTKIIKIDRISYDLHMFKKVLKNHIRSKCQIFIHSIF